MKTFPISSIWILCFVGADHSKNNTDFLMVATLPDFGKQNELFPSSHKTSETINLLEKNSLN